MQRVAGRNQDALMELYTLYGNWVYGLALRVLREAEPAEEITQDVFLKLWRQPERWLPERGQLSTFLLTVTRNAAIDRLRKENRQPSTQPPSEVAIPPDPPAGDFSGDPLWHDGQVLRELLQRLPDEQRVLIELAYYQGYTHSELAANLGLPLGTVKTRVRRGLQVLQEMWHAANAP